MFPALLVLWKPRALCHRLGVLGALLFCSSHALLAWSPGTGNPNAVQDFSVDTTNRTDVLAFYNCVYPASQNYPSEMAWSGSIASGIAGTTSVTFKDDVRRRINFYRALAGLPADITFDATKCSKDQDAALMFARNDKLSHSPTASWLSYTATGAEAAGSSNIALGTYGPGSVDAYITDDGSNNTIVGHRRWLLYSRSAVMGTGDVPTEGSYRPANAVWVIGDFKPAPAPKFVAWPNSGYFPFLLMPARWSLSYPGANFAAASLTMTQGATNVPVTIISSIDNGYGDNTLVWTPNGLPSSINADTPFNVTVSGISGAGVPTSYSYIVRLFDPNVLGDSVTITGTSTPYTTGANYTFNAIAQSDSYELKVSTGSTAAWTEGAEDAPVPQIVPHTTGAYALRQTALKRTGAKAFQLAFPDFTDQSFEVIRDVMPSATSQLVFYDRGRFATTTTTLSAEISTDNGATWTSIFSRPGVGLSSTLWDANFISRSVSLAPYAGQIVHVRFILRGNGDSYVESTTANDGFFIDDVSITNATELVNTNVTALAGTATSFTLNGTTAGAPLVADTKYFMRIRPNVGCRWFGFGAIKTVTAQTPSGYALWVANQYPAATEGTAGDHDKDGLCNGMEYAFGLNPTVANAPSAVPLATMSANSMTLTCTQPAGVTGVTYGAQFSTDLVQWNDVTDTGTAGTHTFTISTVNQPRMFMRWKITVVP